MVEGWWWSGGGGGGGGGVRGERGERGVMSVGCRCVVRACSVCCPEQVPDVAKARGVRFRQLPLDFIPESEGSGIG